MRTSLNKLEEIEHFVLGPADAGDKLVFEAKMIVGPPLRDEVSLQKEAYSVINLYGRRRLKAELETVHQTLFTDSRYRPFKEKILALFR